MGQNLQLYIQLFKGSLQAKKKLVANDSLKSTYFLERYLFRDIKINRLY